MKNYKVELIILDENDEKVISSVTTYKLIEDMKKFHNVSALDEQLNMLLEHIDENS